MFRAYDPQEPLFFIHIPKCAGRSLETVLERWFPAAYFRNVVSKDPAAFVPASFVAAAGTCIGGHFSRRKGRGLLTCYPQARQCLTFLRDPWDVSLSNYFYWKAKNRRVAIRRGLLRPGEARDYRDLDDYLGKTSSYLLNYFPEELTAANYRRVIATYFVFVGIVEELQRDLDELAIRLGRAPVAIPRLNVSPRDEEPSAEARKRFEARHRLEYEVYRYIRDRHPPPRGQGPVPS